LASDPRVEAGIWQAADKVVYSTTLPAPTTTRTRIERRFEPDAIRGLKASADRDLMIGGAELAGEALRAGLIDECQLLLARALEHQLDRD
jgi:dihydrofolate reductase